MICFAGEINMEGNATLFYCIIPYSYNYVKNNEFKKKL